MSNFIEKSKTLQYQLQNNYSATFIEVCAGCGGLSSGFIEAGFKPLLLNDIDKTCCETLRLNHPNIDVVCDSMVNLDLTPYKDKVDLLMGGLSCQSFSISGKRRGLKDERGNLMLEFSRLISETNPKIFLIENVKGLLNHNKGKTLATIIANFPKNYRVNYQLLNAVDYEVPQKRERVFIVGVRDNIKEKFLFPSKIDKKILLKDVLPKCPNTDGGYTYSTEKAKIMHQVPQGGCWVDLPDKVAKKYMKDSYYSEGGRRGILKRLNMLESSLTLTTSPMQKQTERCHPLEDRPLNVREYARIQTFPDTYNFAGSIAAKYRQIGNAVPIRLAYHVAKEVMKIIS